MGLDGIRFLPPDKPIMNLRPLPEVHDLVTDVASRLRVLSKSFSPSHSTCTTFQKGRAGAMWIEYPKWFHCETLQFIDSAYIDVVFFILSDR